MADPIIPFTPFGTVAPWPPSPAKLDRDLDCQNNHILNVNWSLAPINLATSVTGLLPLGNIASNTGPYLLGSTATGSPAVITIGSNMTLTGNVLAANATGGSGTGDFSTNTSTSVASEIVLFSNTTGKQGMRSTGTGVAQLTSGVLSAGTVALATQVTGILPAANHPALTGNVTCASGTVATTIAAGAVTNAMLAGAIAASNLVGTDIKTLGTVATGTWAATPVGVAYGGTGSTTAAGARVALGLTSATVTSDANYQAVASDVTLTVTTPLTAIRTYTLPDSSTVANGYRIMLVDAVGGVSATNYIQIAPFGADTINGSTTAFLMNRAYDTIQAVKTSSGAWVVFGSRPAIRKVFLTTQTYTVPVGVKAIYVEVIGDGGGGGGAASSAGGNSSVGSGGGGGGYSAKFISTPAASYLITIGPGGTAAVGGAGGNGSGTTFGSAVTTNGGSGGAVLATGTSVTGVSGGTGGSGLVGDFTLTGSDGGAGLRLGATVVLGGYGAPSANLSAITAQQILATTGTTLGASARPYGGGGGGALNVATGSGVAGAAGSQGLCLVTEYY